MPDEHWAIFEAMTNAKYQMEIEKMELTAQGGKEITEQTENTEQTES